MKTLKFISIYVMLMMFALMISVDLLSELPDWSFPVYAFFITPGMFIVADKYSKL